MFKCSAFQKEFDMNVIVLEDSSKAGFGGGQKITLDVINALKENYNLYIFDTTNQSLFTQKLKKLQIETIKLETYSKVSQSIFMKIFEMFANTLLIAKNIYIINKFLKNSKIKNNSLIYATTKKGLLLAFMLKKLFNIDFVYHAHMIENKTIRKMVDFLTRKAYKIICVSPLVAEQYNSKNIEIIFNSIELFEAKNKSIINKKSFIISTISSLNYIKGIEYFVESYEFLKNKNITYHIYGEGPLKTMIEQNNNINIKLNGHISNVKEVLLKEIDILVVPTIIPESFGMVILEAFSCGIPVIATDIGMQAVLVSESKAGELVSIKNSKEIAVKIEEILSNTDKYEAYSKNGLNYVKQFEKKDFEQKIIKVFKDYDITNK